MSFNVSSIDSNERVSKTWRRLRTHRRSASLQIVMIIKYKVAMCQKINDMREHMTSVEISVARR